MMKRTILYCLFTVMALGRTWSLDWSLGFNSDNPDAAGKSFSRPFNLRDGDALRILIQSETPTYCYVVAVDSENNAAVLERTELEKGEWTAVGPLILTPPGGQEIFYIVMSSTPQRALDSRLGVLMSRGESRTAMEDAVNEILRIRREVSQLREQPEMPVSMGGSFRGGEFDLSWESAYKYSGAECYVKSIIIRH
ncbi:MAG: DUF4384 domain-containing protein [Treponema sp.]|jgi:hypothetical protein|nr:DUF4384 domain-containing protein [Treponema sp.]